MRIFQFYVDHGWLLVKRGSIKGAWNRKSLA